MTLSQAIKHLFNPQDDSRAETSKRVQAAEDALKTAAAQNAEVTRLLNQTLRQNAHH